MSHTSARDAVPESSDQDAQPSSDDAPSGPTSRTRSTRAKVLIGLVGLVATLAVVGTVFQALSLYSDSLPRVVQGLIAVVAGVGGAALLFYFLNMFVEGLPGRLSRGAIPYAFLLPALLLIGVMLIFPTVQTINYSFANADSTGYVGLQNYIDIFGSAAFRDSIFNNILWLIVVPAVTVFLGVIVAVLADKLSPTAEKVSKSFIFLPLAISFVGAAAIWGLIYAYDPPGDNQTGLLNAIWTAISSASPVAWYSFAHFNINDFLLMVIVIWLQVGFAMILLSAAIKGVPDDTLEAARIDGANELQIFGQVVIPQIRGTIITVFITVLILVLKIFDIVYVTTNGRANTNVIANLFFQEIFRSGNNGAASAIVVVLLVAVTPVLIYQVRQFRREETER